MKKFILAALATVTLGMGVASAQVLDNGQNCLPSPAFSYSPTNG